MQIFRGIPEHASQPQVLTIGNYDGVHLGHQALLRALVTQARALNLPAAVLTFEPLPREFFSPRTAPPRLLSLREKLVLLQAHGVDVVYACRFHSPLVNMSPANFISQILVEGLATRQLILGDDFRFGYKRQGDFTQLLTAGKRYGFGVQAMDTLRLKGQRISSSAVREALADGKLSQAAAMLGRTYSIAGRVISGRGIGNQLGFPTANVQLKHRQPALSGVFVVSVEGLGAQAISGVANIGVRPTIDSLRRPSLEVHLFDWDQPCYGKHLRVHFLQRLRGERKFPSLDALISQIRHDTTGARDWLNQNPLSH